MYARPAEDFGRIDDALDDSADGVVSGGVEKKEGWRSQRQMFRGSQPGGRSYVGRVGVKKTYRLILEKSRVGHGRSRGGGVSEGNAQKSIGSLSEVWYHLGQETPQSLQNQQKYTI